MVQNYATTDQFRSYMRDPSLNDDNIIQTCLGTASREVEKHCGRHFYQHTDTQYFSPDPNDLFIVNLDDMDLATTTGLTVTVEWGLDGTYPETRVFGTDFICEPINQSINGIEGWPFTYLRSVNAKLWPPRYADYYRDTVKVVGTWGWPAVPDPVVQATLVLAAEAYSMSEAKFGYVGFGQFGTAKVRDNPYAMTILQPYKKQTTLMIA